MGSIIIHKLCIDQPQVYGITNCIDTAFQMFRSPVLGQNITREERARGFCQTLFSPCLSTYATSRHKTRYSRLSSSVFAYFISNQKKTGQWRRPRKKARFLSCLTFILRCVSPGLLLHFFNLRTVCPCFLLGVSGSMECTQPQNRRILQVSWI